MATIKRIGIITSGGDCGGLNAVIKGVSREAFALGIEQPFRFQAGFQAQEFLVESAFAGRPDQAGLDLRGFRRKLLREQVDARLADFAVAGLPGEAGVELAIRLEKFSDAARHGLLGR